MKYLIIFFLTLTTSSSLLLHAQQNHFIYLQTDNKQPFYVKFDNKILSSSTSGYLIIGKLSGDNYKLIIGFPRSEWPEQKISINLNSKDAGFLLKNFEEKGWGLFNIQSNAMLMAGNVADKEIDKHQEKETDAFSTMLANVVNDSTILQKDIVKDVVQPSTNDIVAVIKKDELTKKEEPKENVTKVINDSMTNTPVEMIPVSIVKRTLRKKGKEGTELIYVDEFDYGKDTIRIFIPVEKDVKLSEADKDNVASNTILPEQKDVSSNPDTIAQKTISNNGDEKLKEQTIILNPGDKKVKKQKNKKEITKELKEDDSKTKEYKFIEDKDKPHTKSVMINSDCKVLAGEEDFLKLRKKMAGESSDEKMINVARKAFKSKCYSTELVKNLSTLFLKDDGKYMFFDAAYPFVSDSDSFSSLQNQLSDNYYINRFNAMLHK